MSALQKDDEAEKIRSMVLISNMRPKPSSILLIRGERGAHCRGKVEAAHLQCSEVVQSDGSSGASKSSLVDSLLRSPLCEAAWAHPCPWFKHARHCFGGLATRDFRKRFPLRAPREHLHPQLS